MFKTLLLATLMINASLSGFAMDFNYAPGSDSFDSYSESTEDSATDLAMDTAFQGDDQTGYDMTDSSMGDYQMADSQDFAAESSSQDFAMADSSSAQTQDMVLTQTQFSKPVITERRMSRPYVMQKIIQKPVIKRKIVQQPIIRRKVVRKQLHTSNVTLDPKVSERTIKQNVSVKVPA